MNKKGLIGMLAIIVLSSIIKFYWIKNIPLSPIFDFETFYKVAVNLFEGKGFTLDGYPWAFQSYGYPLFLGLFFRMVGNSSIFTAKIFNLICSLLTTILVFFIFNKAFKNETTKWICFILFAFLPNNIIYTNVLGSEVLSTMLLTAIIVISLYFEDNKIAFIVQGVLIGLISLVKPFFIAFPIVLIFIYFIKNRDVKTVANIGVSLFLGFLLIIIPSTIKNYKTFGKVFPISYNGGYTLYINNNSENIRGTWMNAFKVPATDEFKQKLANVGFNYEGNKYTEKEQNLRNPYSSDIFKEEAIKWIKNNPKEFITLGILRVTKVFFDGASDVKLWGFQDFNNMTNQQLRMIKIFISFANAIIYIISASFIVILFSNIKNIFSKETSILFLITIWSMLFFYAVYFVIEGQARYNFPTLFFMVICFGWLLDKNRMAVKTQHTSRIGGNKNVKRYVKKRA